MNKHPYLFLLFVYTLPAFILAVEHTVEKQPTTHEWAFSKEELKEALILYIKSKGEEIPKGKTYTAEWGAHINVKDYAVSLWVEEGVEEEKP